MSKFCVRCGTENDDKYTFCKKCGAVLENNAGPAPSYNPQGYCANDFEGVSNEEMAAFTGKNAYKILNKFSRMQLANSKVSWCWPVAVLSFFFGLFGSAIWFFYRKMYKPALILVAAGLVLSATRVAIYYKDFSDVLNQTVYAAQEFVEDATGNDLNDAESIKQFSNRISKAILEAASSARMRAASALSDIERFGSTVLLGMFAMYIYKKHAVKKIKGYRQQYGNSDYYKYGLSAIGGVSAGMAALGVIIMVFVSSIIQTVPLTMYFMNSGLFL